MVSQRICLALMCVWALSCSSKSSSSESSKEEKRVTRLVGIDPLAYKCENLVTVEEVAEALGSTVMIAQVAFEPPPGTAAPCHYLLTLDAGQQPWSFDMDCRDHALDTADTLFKQYQDMAAKLDAGTSDVDVGKRGMDHSGQAILFVDNDTQCYVRVQGPTAEGRLSLAKLIATKLIPDTAPMRPRPVK